MRTRRWPLMVLSAALLCGASLRAAETAAPAPPKNAQSEARMRRDITFLASDECEGRGPGTKGIDKAADFLAAQFKQIGLRPGGEGGRYFQPFTLNAAVLDEPARLSLQGPRGQAIVLTQGVQFWPMGLGGSGSDKAPVVFAGYGITSPKAHYDDYADIDVDGKIVIVLRGAPPAADRDQARELQIGASFTRKIKTAEEHDAAALLVVNDADTIRDGDGLLDFNYTAFSRSTAKIPVCHVRRSVLEQMLPGGADALTEAENDIRRELKPQSRELSGWQAAVEVRSHRGKINVKNVVGVLEGSGPLAEETVVVGAHYDHLGYGGGGGSLANLKKMAIHHGADDNASGTTALLELARRFASLPKRQGRRLVFIAFSGEELGLFGSVHYCKHPLFPLKQTASMFNLDMVGRLRPDDKTGKPKLLTEGSGTAKPFRELLDRLAARHDFKMVNKPGGVGPSDHASFCISEVPVLFVWTGIHPDYHKPTDTSDKINVEGMRRIVDLSQEAIAELTTMEKPAYIKLKTASVGPGDGPRLGVKVADDDKGLRIEETLADTPAAKAGLKEGDVIVSLAGKPVKGLQGLLVILKGQKFGDTVEVGILRADKPQTVKVTLEKPADPYANMPRLGIRPSYGYEGDGVMLDGVTDGLPADRAGLKKEDVIVRIAGKPVKDLEDYMKVLSAQKKGDTVEVGILRNGKKMTLKVKLE